MPGELRSKHVEIRIIFGRDVSLDKGIERLLTALPV